MFKTISAFLASCGKKSSKLKWSFLTLTKDSFEQFEIKSNLDVKFLFDSMYAEI